MTAAQLTALHMGAMHPYEQALTLILAVGPFVVLGAVVMHRRRQDGREVSPEPVQQAQRDR